MDHCLRGKNNKNNNNDKTAGFDGIPLTMARRMFVFSVFDALKPAQ